MSADPHLGGSPDRRQQLPYSTVRGQVWRDLHPL